MTDMGWTEYLASIEMAETSKLQAAIEAIDEIAEEKVKEFWSTGTDASSIVADMFALMRVRLMMEEAS